MQSIADVAAKAVETPDQMSTVEIIRLGLWYTDHKEHVHSHLALTAPTSVTLRDTRPSLVDRLPPPRGPLLPGAAGDAAPTDVDPHAGPDVAPETV